jgi:phosphoglucosamine mutase
MKERLFGTDGIRGRANTYPMTPEMAVELGRALTAAIGHGEPRIIVGKDTRLSGYMLETAFCAGICAMGGRVLLCGPMPTPAIANLTATMRANAGAVISASHNPYHDNGIKFFGSDGYKLSDATEREIERLIESGALRGASAAGDAVGRAERIDDASGRYIVHAKATFPPKLSLDGIRIVVDAAHGAAYRVAPAVFEELGATVLSIGCEPNGRNINDRHGALHPEKIAAVVREARADLGVALDGDADRLILVDETGAEVDGDTVLAMCGTRLIQRGELPERTVVGTVMSNLGLAHALERAGGRLVRTAVGDRHVVDEMRRRGYKLGGEPSGHVIFLDHATTGDGIVAALQVLAVMVAEERPLSDLATVLVRVPQFNRDVTFSTRKPLEEMRGLSRCIEEHERALGCDGRLVVRWSGTEPKLRMMVESPDAKANSAVLESLERAANDDLAFPDSLTA